MINDNVEFDLSSRHRNNKWRKLGTRFIKKILNIINNNKHKVIRKHLQYKNVDLIDYTIYFFCYFNYYFCFYKLIKLRNFHKVKQIIQLTILKRSEEFTEHCSLTFKRDETVSEEQLSVSEGDGFRMRFLDSV